MAKKKIINQASSKVKVKRLPDRGSQYEDILTAESKLKPGRTITVPIPKGLTNRQFQQRLYSVEEQRIRRGSLVLPKGYRLTKYETEDGELAIELKKIRKN